MRRANVIKFCDWKKEGCCNISITNASRHASARKQGQQAKRRKFMSLHIQERKHPNNVMINDTEKRVIRRKLL